MVLELLKTSQFQFHTWYQQAICGRKVWPAVEETELKIKFAIITGLMAIGVSQSFAGTIYSQDPNLADFTDTVTQYATFTSGYYDGTSGSLPYTPTSAGLLAGGYARVIGGPGWGGPVTVQFGTATSNIVVFDDIDHPGVGADVYQYQILGSNDGTHFTQLFDPQSANATSDPNAFTLGSWAGTAPTTENNTLTYGTGSSSGYQGTAGYEEYFTFATTYSYYQFAPSTLTFNTFENETELAAVGDAVVSQQIVNTASPEPGTILFAVSGLAGLFGYRRFRK